jgi:hypothetical protein
MFRQHAFNDRPRRVGLSLPQIDGRLGELQRCVVRFLRVDVVQLLARGGVVAGQDGAPGIVEPFRIRGRRLRVVSGARIDDESFIALRLARAIASAPMKSIDVFVTSFPLQTASRRQMGHRSRQG